MSLIGGVFAAALTPRRLGMQDVNLGVLWDLIDFLCERKVDGIVLQGSTGEFVHYSTSERMRMMGLAPKRSRVPVLVNVSHSTLDGSVELAQSAMAAGAAGVLLMPPYFFRYRQDAIREFYVRFAAEAELRVPILMYHIPQFTNPIEFETGEWLLRNGVVQGIKDSSGDAGNLERLLALKQELNFTLMVGSDGLFLRARGAGASGIVSGVASALPELLVAMERVIAKGGDASSLGRRLDEFLAWIEALPAPVGIKEAAMLRGMKLGPHAVPCSPQQERYHGEFRAWFKDWLPVVLDECKNA